MHCLNLKVTYKCTNQCSFCFSFHLKKLSIPTESLRDAISQGRLHGCDELVLSGGEPTLCPDLVMELISLAQKIGYKKFIIQTNGFGISTNALLLPFLDETAKSCGVCLSFSIHGHTAEIHDEMSGKNGAFDRVMDAIAKTAMTRCQIYTNTVISTRNIAHLSEIAKLILPYKPTILQFSMMHLSKPSSLSTSLAKSAQAILSLQHIVDLKVLRTEGIPYCLLRGIEECVGESEWPTLDLYNQDHLYIENFKQLDNGMRNKMPTCKYCIMNEICMGVWKEHMDEFNALGILPIH